MSTRWHLHTIFQTMPKATPPSLAGASTQQVLTSSSALSPWALALALALCFSILMTLGTYGAAKLEGQPLSWTPAIAAVILAMGVWNYPLTTSKRGKQRIWPVALGATLGASAMWTFTHWFLFTTASAGFVPFVIYNASYVGLYVYFTQRILRKWPALPLAVVVPVIWTALEVLRGEVVLGGYPWMMLGHTLATQAPSWLASYIGVYGCSFVSLAILAGCFDAARYYSAKADEPFISHIRNPILRQLALFMHSRVHRGAGAALAIALFSWIWLSQPARLIAVEQGITITAVQTNEEQSNKLYPRFDQWIGAHNQWLDLTKAAATKNITGKAPDLIVWPETVLFGIAADRESVDQLRKRNYTLTVPSQDTSQVADKAPQRVSGLVMIDSLRETQKQIGVPMLVGAITGSGIAETRLSDGRVVPTFDAKFNSVIQVLDGEIQSARYDKIDLTPFGEYIPVAWRWPEVQRTIVGFGAAGMAFDLAMGEGTNPTVFTIPSKDANPVRVATPICFEVSWDRSCRRLVIDQATGQRKADIMVSASNDGWFYGDDDARRIHHLMARWRAAELKTPMFRSVNTGISGGIDATGRVLVSRGDQSQPLEQSLGNVTSTLRFPRAELANHVSFWAARGYLVNYIFLALFVPLVVLAFVPRSQRPAEHNPDDQDLA